MELLSTPCFVRKLNIVGNRRTKRALIEAELRAALAARTHEDLAVELALASHRLKDLDVFKSTSCEVDVLPDGGPGDVLISLKVLLIQICLLCWSSTKVNMELGRRSTKRELTRLAQERMCKAVKETLKCLVP
jgi:hypothetical protein